MKQILSKPFKTRQARLYLSAFLFILTAPLLLSSCEDSRIQTIRWIEYEPVYMTHEEFINAVDLEQARDLEKPGKIYFYNGYLFVNEVNEGIHIIDNRDPSAPVNIGFINIPANKDIAVKEERLYADSQKDLLVFNIGNLQQPELIKRVEDVFDNSAETPPGFTTHVFDPSKGIVVDWKPVIKEEVCEGDCRSHPARPWSCVNCSFTDGFRQSNSDASFGANSGGTGGSMARFAISGDYLYTVDNTTLSTFDISTSAIVISSVDLGWGIETIFPQGENLFIGSQSAMYIYDVSNPASPKQLSRYSHATACDPVVVEDGFAFVTLRRDGPCARAVDRLEIINVKQLTRPKFEKFYGMTNPHGLGIDNGRLFVSEGKHGLKIMDASDPLDIKLLRHIKGLKTFDVIPLDGVLMVTGDDGIVQYDYSDIHDLKHLSTIPVVDSEPK